MTTEDIRGMIMAVESGADRVAETDWPDVNGFGIATFRLASGWTVHVFKDAGGWDYIDRVESPSGEWWEYPSHDVPPERRLPQSVADYAPEGAAYKAWTGEKPTAWARALRDLAATIRAVVRRPA